MVWNQSSAAEAADAAAAARDGSGWSSAAQTLPGESADCAPCPVCPSCPTCPTVPDASEGGDASGTSPAEAAGLTCADFDMGKCRQEALESTTPHIIECKEAGEGGSQEVSVVATWVLGCYLLPRWFVRSGVSSMC